MGNVWDLSISDHRFYKKRLRRDLRALIGMRKTKRLYTEEKLKAYLKDGGEIYQCEQGESADVKSNMRTNVKADNDLSKEKKKRKGAR